MLISLLFDPDGKLLAGGRANDQIPLGEKYWRDFLGLKQNFTPKCSTIVIRLSDRKLINAILDYHRAPSETRQHLIMNSLGNSPLQAPRRVVVSRFAA
jgi:hypothetical protein